MNLVVRIPDDVASRLSAAGVNPEQLAQTALANAADMLATEQEAISNPSKRTPAEAAARIRLARAGNVLPDGINIRDLMTDGRA